MSPEALRQQAEARIESGAYRRYVPPAAPPLLAYELEVHHVELELQNEELERARSEAEADRRRYVDLYEHAPIAYLTLDGDGRIVEANHAASALFGSERAELVRKPLSGFMRATDADALYMLRRELRETGRKVTREIALRCSGAYRSIHLLVNVRSSGADVEYLCALLELAEQRSNVEVAPVQATVLLVDDEATLRRSIRLQLEGLGFYVLEAESGEHALQIADERGRAPDIVVSDVRMPEMTGPELVAKLRARWPELPVLYVSGFFGAALDTSSLGERTRLLEKPFSRTALRTELGKLMEQPNPAATILVVEDEEASRRGIAILLSDAGYRVLTAATLAEARTLATSSSIDILLADIRLPDGTGDGLAEELQQLQPNVRIVYMSGAPPTETRVPGAYLEKPLDADDLVELIARNDS